MDEKEYFFLSNHVPANAKKYEESSKRTLEDKRRETLKVCRTQVMFHILNSPNNYEKYLPVKTQIPSWIISPKVADIPTIKPVVFQQSSYFFSFIHIHIIDFVDAFLKFEKKDDFDFLISSAIPCLFGFFASNEHLHSASIFYLNCISKTKPNIGKKIVAPLFQASACFRFLEKVVNPFIDGIVTLNGSKKIVMTLRRLIIKNINMLPTPHRVAITTMIDAWGKEEGLNFFIDFLRDTTINWIIGRFLGQHAYNVDAYFNELKSNLNDIHDAFYYGKTEFETPNLYTVFNDPMRNFFISAEDLRALFEVVKTMKNNEPIMKGCVDLDKAPPFTMFWCKTYPSRKKREQTIRLMPLIFHFDQETETMKSDSDERLWNSIKQHCREKKTDPIKFIQEHNFPKDFEEYAVKRGVMSYKLDAILFENFLTFELNKNVVNDWLTFCWESQNQTILPAAILATQQALIKHYKTMYQTFLKSSCLFSSRKTKQIQYLIILERYLPKFSAPIKDELNEISILWKNILSVSRKNIICVGNFCTKRSTTETFYEASISLNFNNNAPIVAQFRGILYSLKLMKMAGSAEQWKELPLLELISMSMWDGLINLYAIIRLFAMSSPVFCDLLSEEDALLWRDLDQRLKAITKNVPKIMEIIDFAPIKIGSLIENEITP